MPLVVAYGFTSFNWRRTKTRTLPRLHSLRLVHLDIKPSNLVRFHQGGLLPALSDWVMTSWTHKRWFETVGRTKDIWWFSAIMPWVQTSSLTSCLTCGRQIPVEVDRFGSRLNCWFGQVTFSKAAWIKWCSKPTKASQVNLKLDSLPTIRLRIAWHQRRPGGNKNRVPWEWHTKQYLSSFSLKDLTKKMQKRAMTFLIL